MSISSLIRKRKSCRAHTQQAVDLEVIRSFERITVAKLKNGKISDLKEYRMTAFPYMWPSKKSFGG